MKDKTRPTVQWQELVRRAMRNTPEFVTPLLGAERFVEQLFVELAAEAKQRRVRIPRLGTFRMHKYPAGFSVLKFSASKHHRGQR